MSPFTRENYIDAIKNALAYLKSQVELNNAINKYSINIEAETFYAGFLNVVYGFRLKNGNHTMKNIPSIDLYEECQRDDGQRVAVQVTSNNDAKKVKKTLESFCSYDYQKDYTRLIILMITEKKNYRSTFAFPADIGIQFDQSRDIVDVNDLIQNIEQTTETDHLRSIYEYLAKELPSWIIRIGDTEDKRPRETELYDRLFSIFENDRKNHPSIRMMNPDPSLFPKGLTEIFSDGRLAVEEEEAPRAIRDLILDSWKREDRRHILLVGEGGIGKTVAMLMLPVEDWFKKFRIPAIYVPLQKLDAFSGDLNRYIREKIGYDNYDICIQQANSISEGHPRLFLLLDGFNEIPDDYKELAGKHISEWMGKPGVQIITTSRLGFSIENKFTKYYLQPLPYDTVRSFLLSAGIVKEQLPRKNDRIWEVINVPLMLILYTQIEKVREAADRFSEIPIFEWKQPENAARIIWNYLQTELYRCIKKKDPSHSTLQYAAAILAIAPYVCCQMSYQYKFYINMDEFHGLIREALNFYATHQNLLSRQMTNLRRKYDRYHEENLFRQEDAAEYARILIDNMELFQEQEAYKEGRDGEYDIDYTCSLMHQNFRDALAAFFICSCLPKICGVKEKRALLDQADYYVKDYMAELLSNRELVSIWDKHRKEEPEDGQITFILMDLIGRKRNYDYRELDFSGINLTRTNLHRLLSKRLDICPFPRDRSKFSGTNISVECLSPNGHTGEVNSIAFSLDGRQLASGACDGTVRIWDLKSGKSRVLEGHAKSVNSVAYSPNGRQLASGASDNTVRIWDLESGESRVIEGHVGQVMSVAYSPDGRQLASGALDKSVRIWNLESGESRVLGEYEGEIFSVAYSPDGRKLASGGGDSKVRIWDFESGESRVLGCHEQAVTNVTFSADGKQLASGALDSKVRIWNLESGESRILGCHADVVASVAFSPDGRQLASGGYEGMVLLWDLVSGESRVIEGHAGFVRSVAFSPDGRHLASGAFDRTVRIWSLSNGAICVLEGNTGWGVSVAFSPDGRQLASGVFDRTVRIWDLKSGKSRVLGGYSDVVTSVAFSPDGRLLANSGVDRTVRLWDLESVESRVLEGHTGAVNSVAFSPDGRKLASGSFDRTVRIWDLARWESRIIKDSECFVNSVAINADGKYLAFGAGDGTVRIWNLESEEVRVFNGHSDWVQSVAFSPDGRQIVSGSFDRTVRIWDLESGESRVLEERACWVRSVAFSPDGRQIAIGADDGMVWVWDIESGESHVLEGHAGWVFSVAFSPDGRYLASSSSDSTVRFWDLEKYREVKKYAIITHVNLNGANFELAIIDERDKEMLQAAGAKV